MLWHSYSLPPHYGLDFTQADCLCPDGKKKIWCRDSVTGILSIFSVVLKNGQEKTVNILLKIFDIMFLEH